MIVDRWHIKETINAIDNDLEDKLRIAGEIVTSAAKKNSPVVSGRLMNSIDFDLDKNENKVTIGTNVLYAPLVEFGKGANPNPTFFLSRALYNNIRLLTKLFARKIK